MAILRWIVACLLTAAWLSAAHGTTLAVCKDGGGAELAPACQQALRQASVAETLALIEPWVAERQFAPAQQVLQVALSHRPQEAALVQRLRDVQSLAEEATWLARKERSVPATSSVDAALAETRCTRLAGDAALTACEQALRLKPRDAVLLIAKGDALIALGRHAEAVVAYRAAAGRQPDAALAQKIALAEGASNARPSTIDDQLAALQRARDKKLLTKVEYERQRSALLAVPAVTAPDAAARSNAVPSVDFGRYHALVIGNNAYRHLPTLDTAVGDAKAVGELLRSAYGFEVKLLANATRADMVEVLDDYRAKLQEDDNLVIYYAGHGWLDTEADKGFWLPVDAKQDKRTQWVSNDTVRDALRALKAKHVLVIADSCFSGTLTRGLPTQPKRDRDYLKRMSSRKARQVLASGGLEPVADSGGSGHSPFANALLSVLKANTGVIDGTSLFADLRRPVAVNSDQTPQFADIRQAGHQGGDFLFVRRK
jgi:tetratricopeptide (TPR) repeat protein